MSKADKLLAKVKCGTSDATIAFADLCGLLTRLGFALRVKGSHHVFTRAGFHLIDLQPAGRQAKPYQVRQVRDVLTEGGL